MPKSHIVDPAEVRKASHIDLTPIALNHYVPDIAHERKEYGDDRLRDALYYMLLIREFETALDSIKKTHAYRGIEYDHRGPAHLSIGQESASVGQSLALDTDDLVFGSHRSHGEILAKCLSAIGRFSDEDLLRIMRDYLGGEALRIVEQGHSGTTRDLAEDFILYGALSEIFARRTGFNRGMGGSMHGFFAPFGSMPNNAIVGGSADIALGAALFKRINRRSGIVIANIGDSAMGCGPVWEALTMASMDQYHTLWQREIGGAPPVLFSVFNNFYGMGGQPAGETTGWGAIARVGAGVNPNQMHAERIDGYNPLAVADAIRRKRACLERGEGPVLLEIITYRISGHSPSDASSYRTREEVALWKRQDCVEDYYAYLKQHGLVDDKQRTSMETRIRQGIHRAVERAVSLELSPRVTPQYIESVMLSNGNRERFDERTPEVLISKEENPRVKGLLNKHRYAFDADGTPYSAATLYTMRDALFEAMLHRFYEDPTMAAWGEENRDWGGAFAVYRGLTESLPYHRLFNSSISEAAIVGTGVGYAISGGRAVVELMYCDFLGRAGDEVFNQMAKWQSMSAGLLTMPLVLRVSVGSKYGAQHSQDWTALATHIPGLKVMFPATPYDAKGMLNLALRGTDPVVFLESQRLYGIGEQFEPEGVPAGYYEVPEAQPALRRKGQDLTIITVGADALCCAGGRRHTTATLRHFGRGHRSALSGTIGLRSAGGIVAQDRSGITDIGCR